MPKTDSTRYTILFATAVCVVCALLVAASAVGLRERQEANAAASTGRRTCCSPPGWSSPTRTLSDRELQEIFDKQHRRRA